MYHLLGLEVSLAFLYRDNEAWSALARWPYPGDASLCMRVAILVDLAGG